MIQPAIKNNKITIGSFNHELPDDPNDRDRLLSLLLADCVDAMSEEAWNQVQTNLFEVKMRSFLEKVGNTKRED